MSPDIVIVGAGITGCATAYELSKAGLKVEVIEKYAPAAMASGWTLGGVRQSGRLQPELPLARYSVEQWSQLSHMLDYDTGYMQEGNLRLARNEAEVKAIEALVKKQKNNGLDIVYLSDIKEIQAIAPCVSSGILAASFCPTDGHADPVATVNAYKEAAQRNGTVFRIGESVEALSTEGNKLSTVITNKRTISTNRCLLACGVGVNQLIHRFGIQVPLSFAIATVIQTAPTATLLKPVLGVTDGAVTLRQERDGKFRLSSGVQKWNGAVIEKDGQPHVFPSSEKVYSTLKAGFEICPSLKGLQMRRFWGGAIDLTPDALPVLDRLPEVEGIYLASGFSGHGFGIAPAVGHILYHLILGTASELAFQSFALERFEKNQPHTNQEPVATLHG
jgi:sarcosine oxidase subunit beta